MSDLISRSELIEFARNHLGGAIDCNDIARFPAVDAAPVVHAARREYVTNWKRNWQCMACHMIHSGQTTGLLRYCSHCGARYTEVLQNEG